MIFMLVNKQNSFRFFNLKFLDSFNSKYIFFKAETNTFFFTKQTHPLINNNNY